MQSSNRINHIPYFVLRTSYFVLGLGLARLLFEAFFPTFSWLGRPLGALLVAMIVLALAEATILRTGWHRHPATGLLLINLVWLLDPVVDLPRAVIFWLGSVWMTALLTWLDAFRRTDSLHGLPIAFWTAAPAALLYLTTLGRTVGRADTFEFQVVAPQLGIVHPTGYPLYLLLGKLWTLLPFGSAAWRLNLGTAVYGVVAAALTAALIYRLNSIFQGDRMTRGAAAAFGAGLLAITPTFWSQAVEAEVYTLHLLFVAAILLLLVRVALAETPPRGWLMWAGLLGGLGMTHHLTTVFMAPPILLTWLFTRQKTGWSWPAVWREIWPAALFFLTPLCLYLYLPIRWQAVNGEPMGINRWLDWIVGGRFQEALQWGAWLRDPTRYRVIGQLFIDEWPLWLLGLAALGAAVLLWRRWRVGLIFLVVWLGYTFYCLNYYVPDLNVFLLPAHLAIAACAAAGAAFLSEIFFRRIDPTFRLPAATALAAFWLLPLLWLAAGRFNGANAAVDDGRAEWGRGVLTSDLARDAAILADSAKHPPLYYMQQAEGLRPDLDIVILPDEAAYRRQLDTRVAAGQPVYLARFLPNLAGVYHLRSRGPLVEVSNTARFGVPITADERQLQVGPLTLRGVETRRQSQVDSGSTALTLYWAVDEIPAAAHQVFVRWAGGRPLNPAGVHPVHDAYPINAWRPGEVVTDFYLLPIPTHPPESLAIEVALGDEFTPADQLAWTAVATVDFSGWADWTPPRFEGRAVRFLFGGAAVTGVSYPERVRPGEIFEANATGSGSRQVKFELVPVEEESTQTAGLQLGRYRLEAFVPDVPARCGWLRLPAERCVVGEVRVEGVAVPENAVNFGDLIALQDLTLATTDLVPGGTLEVTASWLALDEITEDWTVFVQVLDADDRIAGQVDQFPLQGVRPTSSWRPGEEIRDPYSVPVSADSAPGSYRLIIGFYRLADFQRLPVLDPTGTPIDDKYTIGGLKIEE